MQHKSIAVLGGSGFVGRALCEQLARAGWAVRVLTRARNHARELWPLPATECVECDVYAPAALAAALRGTDAVINLVGILNEKGDRGTGFQRAHVELTQCVIAACATAGVGRYLHMSALNAASGAPSHYLRTKGDAEKLVRAASALQSTIFRPSLIFGPGDGLFVRFDQLLSLAPILPLACAAARFQPVYVGDVAAAFITALDDKSTIGQDYSLGGPAVLSLLEIVRYGVHLRGRRRLILPLGSRLSRVLAEVMEHLPGKPFSRDNLRSAALDSVLPPGVDGLRTLRIAATPLAAIVPGYLSGTGERARYDDLRQRARR
ncbi:MAG: complex I NDUFA9 subunit family protein [Gammaproteobacteria bacterium]|nr:complex I NDUFA9 subunit family protein [Gammaproteobacteria bacterium]